MYRFLMSINRENKRRITDCVRKRYTTERTLKNGLNVIFRPIEPADKSRYNDFFKSLSKESIHMRFFEIKKELSDEMLEKCCNLDYNREIAIVAQPKSDSKIIAVARLMFDFNYRAEFDLAVTDAWQGLGLGSELLKYAIKIAQDYKLKEIYYFVSTDNYKMIRLSNKMGFKVKSTDQDTLEMSLQLS